MFLTIWAILLLLCCINFAYCIYLDFGQSIVLYDIVNSQKQPHMVAAKRPAPPKVARVIVFADEAAAADDAAERSRGLRGISAATAAAAASSSSSAAASAARLAPLIS